MDPGVCEGGDVATAQSEQVVSLPLGEPLAQIVEVTHKPADGPQSDRPNGEPHEGPSQEPGQGPAAGSIPKIPFAEVVSLLDPNMKSTKARKYQIHYEEVKRRLDPPEKMSLRSLAAYTRVSRGPASKRVLLESLHSFGLTPSANTAVSSSFSKLTEGDTAALCRDMRDFASQYMNYDSMVKTLLPDTNQVQHWSKIIETRNHLEEMRKCFHDPANSRTFDNATHGFGTGVLDVAFDMIEKVIDKQIRVLSGNPEPEESQQQKRVRKRKARTKPDGEAAEKSKPRTPKKVKGENKTKAANKKQTLVTAEAMPQDTATDIQSSVLTLVSVGYETISSGL